MKALRVVALALAFLGAAIAVADDEVKNPLEHAKVGAWTIHKNEVRLSGRKVQHHVYTWVKSVDGRKVTLAIQELKADLSAGLRPAREVEMDLDKRDEDAPKPSVSDDEIEVKGQKLKCKKMEVSTDTPDGTVTTTTWVCDSVVPVEGIVRQIVKDANGNEMLHSELADWGDSGGGEKPVN